MADTSPSHTGLGGFPLYRLAEVPFSGGSDHDILSDPSVGVPTPLLIQWPDRYYHTAADTPDRTDPRSLARSGALSAAYAYWLATASINETAALGYEMVARFKGRLVREAQDAVSRAGKAGAPPDQAVEALDRRLAFRMERQHAALATLERLAPLGCLLPRLQAEVQRAAERELAWAQEAIRLTSLGGPPGEGSGHVPGGEPSEQIDEASRLVPVRQIRGPVPLSDHLGRLSAEERAEWQELDKARKDDGTGTLLTLALYWADGARSVLDITGLVELETGVRDLELVLAYFRVLARLGMVAWK
jgi:hypothetical protein